jgi:hypothetical protein
MKDFFLTLNPRYYPAVVEADQAVVLLDEIAPLILTGEPIVRLISMLSEPRTLDYLVSELQPLLSETETLELIQHLLHLQILEQYDEFVTDTAPGSDSKKTSRSNGYYPPSVEANPTPLIE